MEFKTQFSAKYFHIPTGIDAIPNVFRKVSVNHFLFFFGVAFCCVVCHLLFCYLFLGFCCCFFFAFFRFVLFFLWFTYICALTLRALGILDPYQCCHILLDQYVMLMQCMLWCMAVSLKKNISLSLSLYNIPS